LCFFFSSRRRHTRSKRDWSSDVCSSDLPSRVICMARRGRLRWYQIVWGPNKMTWDRGGLKPGMLPGLLGYRLRLAQQTVFRDFAESVSDLSPGRTGMLLLIDANPGVTQGRLAHAVGLDRST